MPVSAPTQVIVHRIELQKTERTFLEDYLQQKNYTSIADSAAKLAGPAAVGVGLYFATKLAIKAWVEMTGLIRGGAINDGALSVAEKLGGFDFDNIVKGLSKTILPNAGTEFDPLNGVKFPPAPGVEGSPYSDDEQGRIDYAADKKAIKDAQEENWKILKERIKSVNPLLFGA
jgi:hypothetical protein|tara:strand:+ start:1766 stop:2284 length:519 start_codon:yes stop_codon:yes gene_type:complete